MLSVIRLHDASGVGSLKICLLGRVSVYVGSRLVPELARSSRVSTLFDLLALVPGHRLHREEVIERLWPDMDLELALNNLHGTLHALRRMLEPDLSRGQASAYVWLSAGLIELRSAAGMWVDVEAFQIAARCARATRQAAAYEAAIDLYTGDLLLGDRDAEWALGPRELLRQAYLALLLELGRQYQMRGDLGVAIAILEQLVAAERTHEEAHHALMQLYAQMGQRRRALRQYQLLSAALRDELDAVPTGECEALYRAIAERSFPKGPSVVGVSALAGALRPIRNGVHQTLSHREGEIATLIGRGLTNREIGVSLGLAKRTVDTHVGRMLRKLGLSSRHQVLTHTYTNGAVSLRHD